MEFTFFFGADKTPFALYKNGVVQASLSTPFHGIISLGMLNKMRENNVKAELWHNHAHFLEDKSLGHNINTKDLLMLKKYATECKMLSFGMSSASVKLYLEKHFAKDHNITKCEIWNIKEGHISSVWKVAVSSRKKTKLFAINVARDNKAGIALKTSSEKIKAICNRYPEINLAKVFDIYTLQDKLLPGKVVITRNEWIDNSYEIHSRKNKHTQKDELLMVERFLTSENRPCHITSILGRIFTPKEVQKIQNDINTFLTKAATCLPQKPEININNGDVVWDGEKAIVVAIS